MTIDEFMEALSELEVGRWSDPHNEGCYLIRSVRWLCPVCAVARARGWRGPHPEGRGDDMTDAEFDNINFEEAAKFLGLSRADAHKLVDAADCQTTKWWDLRDRILDAWRVA